jgi:hypothetical protein
MAGGTWLICNPWPWTLVKILGAFLPVHRFLPDACGFLTGILNPAWVGVWLMCVYLDRVIIVVSDEMGLCSWVYVVGHTCLIICQGMNAPTIVAVISQGAEVPERDGWMPESLSGRPGDAAYLV